MDKLASEKVHGACCNSKLPSLQEIQVHKNAGGATSKHSAEKSVTVVSQPGLQLSFSAHWSSETLGNPRELSGTQVARFSNKDNASESHSECI